MMTNIEEYASAQEIHPSASPTKLNMDNLSDIPALTKVSINILQNQMHIELPPLSQNRTEFTNRIQSLTKTKEKIKNISNLKDDIIQTFATVITIATAITMAIMLPATVIIIFVCFLIVGLVAGQILYLSLSMEPNRKRNEIQDLIDRETSNYEKKEIENAHQNYLFYKEQTAELLRKLQSEIDQLQKNLAIVEPLPEVEALNVCGWRDSFTTQLRDKLIAHQNARDELTKASNFYQQFNAI